MNKICTSKEQSNKLIELGIDRNTADMKYKEYTGTDYSSKHSEVPFVGNPQSKDIPCWSLAALLEILSDITDYSFELVFLKRTTDGRGDVLENIYRCSVDMKDTWNTESLDAIFEMIVWLKEN